VPFLEEALLNRSTRFRLLLGAGLILFFGVAHVYGLSGIYASVWSDTFWTLASLGTGILCLGTARHCERQDALAWRLFGAASLSWFVGMLIWSYFELVKQQATPFPAVSDIFFMLFAPLFGWGLWSYRPAEGMIETGRRRRLLDLGLVVAASFVTVVLLFYGNFAQQKDVTLYFAAAVTYPVLYLTVAIFAISRAWLFVWGRKRWIFALLLSGMLLHAIIDTVYAYALLGRAYRAGDFIDVVWLLGFALIAVAAYDTAYGGREKAPSTGGRMAVVRTEVSAYEPVLLLLTSAPMLVTYLLFSDTLDAGVKPFLIPAIAVFLLLAVAREIRGRLVEMRLLLETQETAAKLAESEREFADLATASSDRFWVTNEHHRFIRQWGAGRPDDDLDSDSLGQTRWELSGADLNRDHLWKEHLRVLERREPFRDLVYATRSPDGAECHWSVSGVPFFGGSGKFLGYRGVSQDITAQVEADRALKASEAKWSGILSITPDAIVACDDLYRVTIFNPGAEALFGYTKEEILGQDLGMLLPERFRATHRKHVVAFSSHGEISRLMNERAEVFGLRKDGSEFPAGVSISRLALGQRHLFTAMIHDLTLQKQHENEVIAARDAAEIANRAKSEFLANMSHELRTPLNAVIGFSDALAQEFYGTLTKRQQGIVHDVGDAGRHLLDLINDILDLSKIEAGKFEPYFEEVDVARTINSSLRLISDRAAAANVEIGTALPETLPALYADERLLKQMLINLLSNGVKFTPSGGKITVKVLLPGNGGMQIEVCDTGCGMKADDIPTALSAFGQVDGTLTRRHEGSGLGLPLVQSFMQLHGGQLDIESEEGVGTAARLNFPASQPTQTASS
jgi:PAS domain S-box-containing protein